jgi:hypothetical protein
LGEGGPNQIGGQVFQGFLLPGLDASAGKDVEAGVSPAVEHADEFPGDLFLTQEHREHLQAEELLQVLELEWRSDPEQALLVKTTIRAEDVQVGVKALRVVTKGV